MNDKENDKLLEAITQIFNRMAEPLHTEIMELSARLSSQRFLLEQLYANAFLNNPDAFTAFMENASQKNSTRSGPMPEDVAQELEVRIATHLKRFQESVEKRLRD